MTTNVDNNNANNNDNNVDVVDNDIINDNDNDDDDVIHGNDPSELSSLDDTNSDADDDDDDDDSCASNSGGNGDNGDNNDNDDDDNGSDRSLVKKQILSMSKYDTMKVKFSQLITVFVFISIAFFVSYRTYKILSNEENDEFASAFAQFAHVIKVAAIQQQIRLRKAVMGLSITISSTAEATNATWPFYTLDKFESYASAYRQSGRCEFLAHGNLVYHNDRMQYEHWANTNYKKMVDDGYRIQNGNEMGGNLSDDTYHPSIMMYNRQGIQQTDINRTVYYSTWSWSPPPISYGMVNWNFIQVPVFRAAMDAMMILKNQTVVTPVRLYHFVIDRTISQKEHEEMHSDITDSSTEHPHSFIYHPIHRISYDTNSDIVGVIGAAIAWDRSLINLLPSNVPSIIVVFGNNCNDTHTYEIINTEAIYLGVGDLHDISYNQHKVQFTLDVSDHPNFTSTSGHCLYYMAVYPSLSFEQEYKSNTPLKFSIIVGITYLTIIFTFHYYNITVRKRNDIMIQKVVKSNGLIANMFGTSIWNKIIANNNYEQVNVDDLTIVGNKNKKTNKNNKQQQQQQSRNIIADVYLESTIMLADITDFTAWSSVREPHQVFTFLEVLFGSFDVIAKRRRVYKVETAGDCYVAVAGLPEPRIGHAAVMVRFATDILKKMTLLTKELETSLGPDTGDLSMRIGIHSGLTYGGIITGERARFQLFGETMNIASKMESSGSRGCIQVSKHTADLLRNMGKDRWLKKRKTLITHGNLQLTTYWCTINTSRGNGRLSANDRRMIMRSSSDASSAGASSVASGSGVSGSNSSNGMSGSGGTTSDSNASTSLHRHATATYQVQRASSCYLTSTGPKHTQLLTEKSLRLVDWNALILAKLLKQVVALRKAQQQTTTTTTITTTIGRKDNNNNKDSLLSYSDKNGDKNNNNNNNDNDDSKNINKNNNNVNIIITPLDEVQEIIRLPAFDRKVASKQQNPNQIELDNKVIEQLREYITIIAGTYRDNPFHNFDHCSHVLMSVVKLLSRIVAPSDFDFNEYYANQTVEEHNLATNSTATTTAVHNNNNNNNHNNNNKNVVGTNNINKSSTAHTLHDHTYGITSDPLTQFACAFSALIHDVDHTGVPNGKVIDEEPVLAARYNMRSVAEQNSLDIAWNLLHEEDRFSDLRETIYSTETERIRFRQLVVNSVMATDIGDKQLKNLRNMRWDKAFNPDQHKPDKNVRDAVNRKATIVIEHLIQASDVSHTMQHWHIYRKWNARLFEEMYRAYKDGRADTDPSEFWYKGEIGFFDFYIIPLTEKLKDCGVFGKSSDEYLNYAISNRNEWEQRGREITAEMKQEMIDNEQRDEKKAAKKEKNRRRRESLDLAPDLVTTPTTTSSPAAVARKQNNNAATQNAVYVPKGLAEARVAALQEGAREQAPNIPRHSKVLDDLTAKVKQQHLESKEHAAKLKTGSDDGATSADVHTNQEESLSEQDQKQETLCNLTQGEKDAVENFDDESESLFERLKRRSVGYEI